MNTGFRGGAARRGRAVDGGAGRRGRLRARKPLAIATSLGVVWLAAAALSASVAAARPIVSAGRESGPVSATLSSPAGGLQGLLATSTGGCSWQTQYGANAHTALETDTSANYWATSFLALPGGGITIQGTFPVARNMSFTVYHSFGAVFGGHLYDAQIQPDSGVNPFQQGQTGTGTYTIHVIPGMAPANPAPNTLYTNSGGLVELELIYRIYDPTDPNSAAGDVPLPQTTITFNGKPETVNQPCVSSAGPAVLGHRAAARSRVSTALAHPRTVPGRVTAALHRGHAIGAVTEPSWFASKATAIFADPDNAYLSARISSLFGQLVVLRAPMPTFPDTNAGGASWDPGQVRYWSVCANNGLAPVVTGCAADFNAVQSGGVATFVISSPANRPPNATVADGVNWLPWGSSSYGVVLYRQMLADPAFSQSIASVPQGSPPGTTMGSYLPQIAYCSEAVFAAAGADGCLGSG